MYAIYRADPKLVSPELRISMRRDLKKIALGEEKPQTVL